MDEYKISSSTTIMKNNNINLIILVLVWSIIQSLKMLLLRYEL